MATEDVIELGSSDDDGEPAPKKAKPMANAMVHIPNKIADVTIHPVKRNMLNINRKLQGKSVTITKLPRTSVNPCAVEIKTNGKVIGKAAGRQITKTLQKPIPVKQALNPISLKMTNSQVVINKVPVKLLNEPVKISKLQGLPIISFPSSIVVKKPLPSQKYTAESMGSKLNNNLRTIKKLSLLPKANVLHNQILPKASAGEVLTVDLDDDDTHAEITKGPQWYLRPEEQVQSEEIMEKNNAEPKPSSMIEITIEDSPIKSTGRHNEIGSEYAITIEDSPIKFVADKNTYISDEDSHSLGKQAKSKKELVYPNDDAAKTVEIELEPIHEVHESSHEVNRNVAIPYEIESEKNENLHQEQKKMVIEVSVNENILGASKTESNNLVSEKKEENEFHPVYQSFIDLCFELENSDDMQKIVEKKVKGYYKQVPREFTESEEFIDMVSSKISSMKAGPERMYLYIKDVVDELNFKRKSLKTDNSSKVEAVEETEKFLYGEESEFDTKRQRQIRRLEKTLKKLHRAIQKLEEQEVDFDDEEDSVYLLTERYKARMMLVHAKFCQLTNSKLPSEPRVHIEARPGQPAGPAKRLEKWVNKKVPIGKPLPFPDFHDVLKCVREANKEDKLGWNEAEIMDEARDLFIRCGKKLQRRRQENEWRLAASRISHDVDPAKENADLKKKLEQNQLIAAKKETELLNKYADKQKQMKLEAVEIEDKEAEESPVESEDEESDGENALSGSTAKWKQGLKKMLQQKYAKNEKKGNEEICNKDNTNLVIETINTNKTTKANVENKQTAEDTESSQKQDSKNNDIQSLSDDSSNMNTDVDELHLLHKLHSEPEACSSTMDSSDLGSPIAISDSSIDSLKKGSDGVISIENSSYSESEAYESRDIPEYPTKEILSEKNNIALEIDCSNIFNNPLKGDVDMKVNKGNNDNNDEYNESVEDILLASTDEETTDKMLPTDKDHVYVNLNDDTLSIEETVIGGNGCTNTVIRKPKDYTNVSLEESNNINSNETNDDCPKKRGNAETEDIDLQNPESTFDTNKCNGKITSANDNVMSADTTSSSVIATSSKSHKEKNKCVTEETSVGSSTEAMEVTTSQCDSVNV